MDAQVYPSTVYDGQPTPKPDWVCRGPNGGMHIDRRAGRIDIDVAQRPVKRIEINSSEPFQVRVLAEAWLDQIRDLVDESEIFVGEVRKDGKALSGWATVNHRSAPPLIARKGGAIRCTICGSFWMTLWGVTFFTGPNVLGRPLIVNPYGVFVREDLALSRNLRRPSGAFKPTAVGHRPSIGEHRIIDLSSGLAVSLRVPDPGRP